MVNIDSTMQKKIIDKISEMESNLTTSEFKTSLRKLFEVFSEKMKDDKSLVHIETFIDGVVRCLSFVPLETKLSACLFLFTYINLLPNKESAAYNKFAELLEKDIAPKIYELFQKLQLDYLNDKSFKEDLVKSRYKQQIFMLILVSIITIFDDCISKFGTDKNNKARRFQGFYNELQIEKAIKKELFEYADYTLDVLQNKQNYFKKVENETPEGFRQRVKMALKEIAQIREEMKYYLNPDFDTKLLNRFDEKINEYKEQMCQLQELISNKQILLDESLKVQVSKEEKFTLFLFHKVEVLFVNENCNINRIIQIILDKHEEIFNRNREKLLNVSHESIKFPIAQKQIFVKTDSDLEEPLTPNNFKYDRNLNEDIDISKSQAFSSSSQIELMSNNKQFFAKFAKSQCEKFENNETGLNECLNRQNSLQFNSPNTINEEFFLSRNPIKVSSSLSNIGVQSNTNPSTGIKKSIQKLEAPRHLNQSESILEKDPQKNNESLKINLIAANSYSLDARYPNKQTKNSSNNGISMGREKSLSSDKIKFQESKIFLNNSDKNLMKNFEDFENLNQSIKIGPDDKYDSINNNLMNKLSLENYPTSNIKTSSKHHEATSPGKNVDFNTVFLQNSNLSNIQNSNVTRHPNTFFQRCLLKNIKRKDIFSNGKMSQSVIMEQRPNTLFQFQNPRFSLFPQTQPRTPFESKSLIFDAMHKVSAITDSNKKSQIVKSTTNLNDKTNTLIVPIDKQSTQFLHATCYLSPMNIKNQIHSVRDQNLTILANSKNNEFAKKSIDPFDNLACTQIGTSQNENRLAMESFVDPINDFKILSEKKFNESNSILNPSNPPDLELLSDEFYSAHSEEMQTPLDKSILKSSNIITPSIVNTNKVQMNQDKPNRGNSHFQNHDQKFTKSPSRIISVNNNLLFPKSSNSKKSLNDNKVQAVHDEISYNQNTFMPTRTQSAFNFHIPFDDNITIKDNRLSVCEINKKQNNGTPGKEMKPQLLYSPLKPSNYKIGPNQRISNHAATIFKDDLCDLRFDEKLIERKVKLEKAIEEYKLQMRNHTNEITTNSSNVQHQQTITQNVFQDHLSLVEKLIVNYEILIKSNRLEVQELKNQFENLIERNNKNERKTLYLQSEVIGLKKRNFQLNALLASLESKYGHNLSEQNTNNDQSLQMKMLDEKRLCQQTIESMKVESETNIAKLTEELKNYAIENAKLKNELELANKITNSRFFPPLAESKALKSNHYETKVKTETDLHRLGQYIGSDLTQIDRKNVSVFAKVQKKQLDTAAFKQMESEVAFQQTAHLYNDPSLLGSNSTINFQDSQKQKSKSREIVDRKIKTENLKSNVKESCLIINYELEHMKNYLANTLLPKMRVLSKTIADYEKVPNSQHNQITKLTSQNEILKNENSQLKEHCERLLKQNKTPQKKILEDKKEGWLGKNENPSGSDWFKKIRQLEPENKSLVAHDEQNSTNDIQSKEKNELSGRKNTQAEQFSQSLKTLQIENQQLLKMNKSPRTQLYEMDKKTKESYHNDEKSIGNFRNTDNLQFLDKPILKIDQFSKNCSKTNMISGSSIINQTSFNQNISEKNIALTGTAFIKKFEMIMEFLNSEGDIKETSKTLLDWINHRPLKEYKHIANLCSHHSYCLLQNSLFNLHVDENIYFNDSKIHIKIQLTFSNLQNYRLNIINLKVKSESKFCTLENFNDWSIELKSHASFSKVFIISFDENYLIEMIPVFLSFGLLDQALVNSYSLSNNDTSLVKENCYSIILPLSINKLLLTRKEELPNFNVLKTFPNVGECEISNKNINIEKHLFSIIPNLLELSQTHKIFAAKIDSLFGFFFIVICINSDHSVKLRIFAVRQSSLHVTYLETLSFILTNL